LNAILAKVDGAAQNGAQLVAFPELALTGYKYAHSAEALEYAETVPGPSTEAVAAKAQEHGVYVVFGLLEKDGADVFDTVVLVGPEGYVGKYRKVHEGYQSESLVFTRGSRVPPVFATPIGRIGLANCYDGAFPEAARLLALQGADIMVFIYNESGAVWRDYVLSRATENGAFVVAPNRIGSERLSSFNGTSIIAGPGFQTLAIAGATGEQTIYADLDLGQLSSTALSGRRPALYEAIAEPYPAQILSADATPESSVAGEETGTDVTIVTASIAPGTPVTATLRTAEGVVIATVRDRLDCNRKRLGLQIPAAATPGDYLIHVAVGRHDAKTVDLPFTVKAIQKPVALGRLPVGEGAANKGTIYVSYDLNVKASTSVPIQLIGPSSTVTLRATINTSGIDNRLSASYSGLAYGASYTVVIPAGSVQSIADLTYNDELRFQFVVQPAPLIFKAAAVQTLPQRLNVEGNLAMMLAKVDEAAASGSKLVVFPELTLSGNGFASWAEAAGVAETIPGPSVDSMVAKTAGLGVYVAFGMLEKDGLPCSHCFHGRGWRHGLYSTMVLVGPEGYVGKYRKTHVGASGDDRFLRAGDAPSEVFETTLGPIGLSLGRETFYPEVARSLFVRGALLIASGQADDTTLWAELARTRASENKVYYVAANRVGTEGETLYSGLSIMAATSRKVLVQASATSEQIVYADLNMYDIQKRIYQYIDRPTGKVKATDYNFDRSPFLYEALAWHPEWRWQAPRRHGMDRFRGRWTLRAEGWPLGDDD
jgi:predicted amidohydrolase